MPTKANLLLIDGPIIRAPTHFRPSHVPFVRSAPGWRLVGVLHKKAYNIRTDILVHPLSRPRVSSGRYMNRSLGAVVRFQASLTFCRHASA